MHDDDSRGLETPARADASPAHKPTTVWIELTAFQRDCLEAITRLERANTPNPKAAIVHKLERTYPRVTDSRLEPNLRALVGRGLLAKRDNPDGPSTYRRTDAGRALVVQRAERLAAACEIGFAATDSETAAREPGENG